MKIYKVIENADGAGMEVWRGEADSPEHAVSLAYAGITDEDCGDLSLDELRESAEAQVVEEE
ncbi:MAG: hypothetical protein DRP65_07945 [Planctomycetota bacterium]|nr:MAG: hypothetical protein DRP65_07945 [Planctomycetota bacterium]